MHYKKVLLFFLISSLHAPLKCQNEKSSEQTVLQENAINFALTSISFIISKIDTIPLESLFEKCGLDDTAFKKGCVNVALACGIRISNSNDPIMQRATNRFIRDKVVTAIIGTAASHEDVRALLAKIPKCGPYLSDKKSVYRELAVDLLAYPINAMLHECCDVHSTRKDMHDQ